MQTTQIYKPNYEARIGLFALIAIILLLWGWAWLKSISLFHPPQRFTVLFHDIAGLNTNAPVNINGLRVGTVEKLELKGKGQVLAGLKINTEDVMVPQGSRFTIQTLGLVGAKYIEITLPEIKPSEPPPPILEPNSTVIGQDPVRVELVINKIADNLADVDIPGMEQSLHENMKHLTEAANNVAETAHKFGEVAESTRSAASSANSFFERGSNSFDHINALADDWRSTSKRMNKILNNPALSADLKETAEKAKQTADSIQVAIHELNGTIADKSVRADLLAILGRIDASTENIYKSVQVIHKVTDDQGLRTDIKQSLSDVRAVMGQVDKLVSQPTFGGNMKATLNEIKSAAEHIDLVARQLKQILEKKHPLVHMLFGRPGYIREKTKETESYSQTQSPDQVILREPLKDKSTDPISN